MSATLLTAGAGSVAFNQWQRCLYTTSNFNGQVLIGYTATDNGTTNGAPDPKSASATITVNVAAVNDPPIATTTTVNVPKNVAKSIIATDLFIPGPSNESGRL